MAQGKYREAYDASLAAPAAFWARAAEEIAWFRRWDRVLDADHAPFYRWFAGAQINTCYNAVDRHVEAGRGEQLALVYVSPMTGIERGYSFRELEREVAALAGALAARGVGRGDTVVIYMPMVPQAVFAMLACARLGAVHSVVFGGFAAPELAARIDDCRPKIVLSASCGLEPQRVVEYKPLLDKALALAHHEPQRCIVLQRPELRATLDPRRDLDWDECAAAAAPHECVPVAATDPLYVLYTSGTTGRPKGVVRDNGGHAVALAFSMRAVYAMAPGETYWAASDIGWVVGHSYIVYGPLLNGNTTLLYEGKPVGTPDAGAFWRVAAKHNVKTLFTAPTALRAIKREDPHGAEIAKHGIGGLEALYLAGERTDPPTLEWAASHLRIPVVDHWWQTETGWAICATCRGIENAPIKPGSTGRPVPGMDVRALEASGREAPRGRIGALAIKLPLPPGTFLGLWNAEAQCRAAYFDSYPGFYSTADAGFVDADGYVHVMARTDDVINVAGHRLSTGAIEEVLAGHPDIAECAVFGIDDALKGQVPIGLLVLNALCARAPADVVAESIVRVREHIGPVAAFKSAAVVARLPKTRSGKILRGVMRRIANAEQWSMPATIDDPAALDEVRSALIGLGIPGAASDAGADVGAASAAIPPDRG